MPDELTRDEAVERAAWPQLCVVLWLDSTATTATGAPVQHVCRLDPFDGHDVHVCTCGRRSSDDAPLS